MDIENLIKNAIDARKMSYSPYSSFKVGSALLTDSKIIYKGCNIESASYTPTNCAERTSFFKAISEGERSFKAIAIVGGYEDKSLEFCYPCGVCRQVMIEFCDIKTFKIIIAKSLYEYKEYSLEALFPFGFKL